MKFRRFAMSGLAALTVAIVPGIASAAAPNCTGVSSMTGVESPLQGQAQRWLWNGTSALSFNMASDGCSASSLPVFFAAGDVSTWTRTGDFTATDAAFVETDDALTTANYSAILAHSSAPTDRTTAPLTFPVAQQAIAVVVHLPDNCTVASGLGVNRNQLGLTYRQLDGIWTGSVTTWHQLSASQPSGAGTLTGVGCNAMAQDPIRLIVPAGSTSASAALKRLLYQYDTGTQTVVSNVGDPGSCSGGVIATWSQLSVSDCNAAWPAPATRAIGTGDSNEAENVAALSGTIGITALMDARLEFGGAGNSLFWAELPAASLAPTATPSSRQWTDPSTNGDVATIAGSTCTGVSYQTGSDPTPQGAGDPPILGAVPTDVNDSAGVFGGWASVFDAAGQGTSTAYSACTLTYDLALGNYADYPRTSSDEDASVKKYLSYITGANGQALLSSADYASLPGSAATGIRGISIAGLSEIQ